MLLNQKVVTDSGQDEYRAINQHFLAAVLRPLIRQISVDAAWYLATYPDVARAIEDKIVRDVQDHYERFGYFENRLPYKIAVQEEWYETAYPDVGEAIARREFASAQDHFEQNGFAEGRLPYPGFELERV